ncbi:MAG TPA: glycosyltransferase [Bacteroidales bacterium]|nr:glycosyltransferase [Bacteroidales bacterium]HQG62095.1 glycosyltransferase [Bacteroidales bacterium]HQK68050.1 glycosyltransferase [Bacteroidales bacterium]
MTNIAADFAGVNMLQDNLFLSVVFMVFAFAAFLQVLYYLCFYLAVILYRQNPQNHEIKPVSVIICARNEAENLKKFLPIVLEQDYPDYEVIVVNDCSEDNTYDILGSYLQKYPHLKISTVNRDPRFTHNKKFAQFIGIKAASNDILLFTDADCYPESKNWISNMTCHFHGSTDIVLGYGGYLRGKGLLNKYIRYDTMTIALNYLGMAIRGIPYMGVGRNLAYNKSLFFKNKGFGRFNHLISGDDDLFVNSNATRKNTVVEFRKDSHTRSLPPSRLKLWIKQKKRHFTTAPYYRLRDKILLLTEPVSRFIFYTTFAVLISLLFYWKYALLIFGLRLILQILILVQGMKKLNESGLLFYSIIFDIFSPLINGSVYLSNLITRSRKNTWK